MANTNVGSWDDKNKRSPTHSDHIRLSSIHTKAVLEGTGQGGLFARERETMGRLQVDYGEIPVTNVTCERCELLHLQSTDRRTDTVWFPCVARSSRRM